MTNKLTWILAIVLLGLLIGMVLGVMLKEGM